MKFAITVARVGDKLKVINGPDLDVDGQVASLRELTNAKGVVKTAKSTVQIDEAVLLHSVKGVLKTRRF